MKIVHCPKGGRIPEGYCRESCLNYRGLPKKENRDFFRKVAKFLKSVRKTWIQVYNEEFRTIKKIRYGKNPPYC